MNQDPIQCPLTSSLGEFAGYWDWLWYPGLLPLLVSIAFHISVFLHPLFVACHWISFVFFLYDQRIWTHSIDPSLTHFIGEFLGLESRLKLLHYPGFELRTLQSNGRERYH